MTRTPDRVKDLETFRKHSVRLSFGNEKVAKDNYECLTKLKQPIATVNAKHNNTTASKLPEDDMGSLMPQLLISKTAKVMLTRNLWTDVGLCNGAIGIVKHIIYKHGDLPPSLPVGVIVQFDENYIGPSVCKEIPRRVPITPVINTSDTLGFAYEREQLSVKLAWSITIHKSQGLTLSKPWIDIGPSEKVAGLAYVALPRVRALNDLVIEPMTLERLNAVKKSSNYEYRVKEESRLANLSQKTVNEMKRFNL